MSGVQLPIRGEKSVGNSERNLIGSVAVRGDIVQFGRPRDAQMTKPIARDLIYRRRRFDAEANFIVQGNLQALA